ncbi:MAG: GTPase ObgE, GTP-binding protein [Candidatus Parcubacteria bacterium]|jgi:GTP-binding protein
MFVDEMTITAHAGKGGDGVVRWLREWARPWGGPAGGDGGKGGDVYMRAVRDLALLARYRSSKEFKAQHGVDGQGKGMHGAGGADLVIDVPMGSIVIDRERGTRYELKEEGETVRILRGGNGGLGNEYFKSSTNRSPEESTKGKPGEEGIFDIELELVADVGLVGLPNAGKSSILNALTAASSKIGAYPFTTLEPHLGTFYGYVLADIPGLIEGASEGKGLGHKFLRHVRRTRTIVHCVSLENEDVVATYNVVRAELQNFDDNILQKDEIVLLTKTDLVSKEEVEKKQKELERIGKTVYVVSVIDDAQMKAWGDALSRALKS